MLYAKTSGGIEQASRGVIGNCINCDAIVHAKCGEIRRWHFAHKDSECCDSWSEGETSWHLNWKSKFPQEMVEVRVEKHQADFRHPKGIVIEFQHSYLSPVQIRRREAFYKNMIWVLDAKSLSKNIDLYIRSGNEDMPDVTFRWRWRSDAWKNAKCPLIIDFTNHLPGHAISNEPRLLYIKSVGRNQFGTGKLIQKNVFIKHFRNPVGKLLDKAKGNEIVYDVFTEMQKELQRIELEKATRVWDYSS